MKTDEILYIQTAKVVWAPKKNTNSKQYTKALQQYTIFIELRMPKISSGYPPSMKQWAVIELINFSELRYF